MTFILPLGIKICIVSLFCLKFPVSNIWRDNVIHHGFGPLLCLYFPNDLSTTKYACVQKYFGFKAHPNRNYVKISDKRIRILHLRWFLRFCSQNTIANQTIFKLFSGLEAWNLEKALFRMESSNVTSPGYFYFCSSWNLNLSMSTNVILYHKPQITNTTFEKMTIGYFLWNYSHKQSS